MKTPSRWKRLARRLLPLSPFLIAAGAALWDPSGASASLPATTASTSGMVALSGSVHPWIRRGTDLGPMDPAQHLTGMSILFSPSASQKALLDKTLRSLQDPTSPSYHRWLSPEDYAARFGASPADIARTSTWLSSHGLTVDGPSRTSTRLAFSGTVAQIEQAFATEMHRYTVDGADHFAMSRAPSVPADLASVILGLHGMHDFRIPPPVHAGLQPEYAFPFPLADGGTQTIPTLAPADFAKIYDVAALYAAGLTGAGQRIAVAEQTDFNDADIATFRSTFSLSVNPPVRVLMPNTGAAQVLDPGDLGEAELDTEWAGAVAQDATIDYVFVGNSPNSSVFDALTYAIEQATAPIVSISYGQCEDGVTPSDVVFYEAMGDSAALMGVTVLAASGDTGAAGCDGQFSKAARHGEFVGLPASIPSVVAVGGTQFQLTEANVSTYFDSNLNALGYIPESGWNETVADEEAGAGGLGASTGGVSVAFVKPYWQVPYTPNDKFRDVPDVALSASALVTPYITSGSWTTADGDASTVQPEALSPVGGTSAAAPSFAGILALVNQAIAKANPGTPVGLGNANPVLYALANNTASAAAFHDITTGNNIVPCQSGSLDCPTTPPLQFGYSCGPGYDQVTGLGSVDAAKLVAAWTTLTPTSTALTVTAAGTTEGSSLQLEATVASTAKTTGMTGTVSFYFETFDANGNIDLGGTLGTVPITPTTSGNEGGTASLKTQAPAGLKGSAKIGAFYGGDVHYLASWSALDAVSATSNLAICPTAVTLLPSQTGFVFQTTGGVPPINFSVTNDNTCARVNHQEVCSSFDGGVFTAGPTAGTATVVALDQYEAYVTATVTVAGNADAGTPLPTVSCVPDAGADASLDATADATAAGDASGDGGETPAATKGGCGCVAAGDGGGALAGWSGVLLGLAALGLRRRTLRPSAGE
jgi:subtilase family serine protease